MPIVIIKYSWFVGIPIGLLNAIMFNRRVVSGVKPDSPERREIAGLTRGYFLWFSVPSLAMGVLQLLGGHQNPLFVFSREFRDPTILASWAIMITLWAAMLWWVWIGRGAKTIVKYSAGFNAPPNETGVKLITTMCVLAGAIALTIGSLTEIGKQMEKIIQQPDGAVTQESAPSAAP